MSKKANALIYLDKDPDTMKPADILVDASLTLPAVKRMIKLYKQVGIDTRAMWNYEEVLVK